MAFTKVVGAGIHTLSNITSHNINSSGIITATKFVGPMENGSGISTFYDLRVTNNLTVEGTTTTLDTKLVEVDKIEVEADSTNVAIAVTHTGSGDILRLYDSASQVVTVDDEGQVGIGTATAAQKLDVVGNMKISGNIDANGDLDVDGLTNLDNTIVAGIATFTNVVTKFAAGNGGNTHLQVLSTGTGEAGIFFDAANGDISGSDYIFIGQQNNLDFIIKANPNAGNIDFQRGETKLVRIDTNGDVGINTTSPQNSAHFQHYTSTARHQSFQSTDGDLAILSDNNSNPVLYVKGTGSADLVNVFDNTTEVFTIKDGGNVGINEDDPAYPLEVVGDGGGSFAASSNSTNGVLSVVGKNSSGGISAISRIKSYPEGSSNQSHMAFETRRSDNTMTEALRISATQDVGIGETTPDSKLDILHSSSTNPNTENLIHLRTDPGAGYVSRGLFIKIGRDINYDNSGAYYDIVGSGSNSGFHAFQVSGSDILRITKDGNIGIGLTTTASVNVLNEPTKFRELTLGGRTEGAAIHLKDDNDNVQAGLFTSDSTNAMIIRTITNHPMMFRTNNSERLRIANDGKVGISTGTIDPDGNQLLIRAASTVGTKNAHIMLTGDGATINEGPQIVFSESGSGSSYAGGSIGFERKGDNSQGDLIFGTRGTAGGPDTTTTERLRIKSNGNVVIGNSTGTQPSATVGGAQFWGGSYPGDFRISSGAGASGTEAGAMSIMGSNHNASLAHGSNYGAQLSLFNYNTTDGNSTAVSYHNSNGLAIARVLGVNISHSNREGALVFMTSTTGTHPEEKARIDSDGRFLIGTTTEGSAESDDLTIATSGHTGITLRSGTTHEGNIFFSDGTSGADEYRGLIRYDHDGDKMIFGTGDGSTRLTITNDGTSQFKGRGANFEQVETNQYNSSWTAANGKITIKGDLSGGNYFGWRQKSTASGSVSQTNAQKKLPSLNDFTYPNSSNGMLIASTSKIGFSASAESPQYANGVTMLFDSTGLAIGNNNAFDCSDAVNTVTAKIKLRGSGKVEINDPAELSGRLTLKGTNTSGSTCYAVTNSGKALEGIDVTSTTCGPNNYGGAISFGCGGNGRSAIAGHQAHSDFGNDDDMNGLAFFTHTSSTGSDNASLKMTLHHDGGLRLHNWNAGRGYIFRRNGAGTYPDFPNVQASGGRGMIDGQREVASGTATDIAKSHWGGLALVGFSNSQHQGVRHVLFGYGNAGATVQFSGNWVSAEALTVSFQMSGYTLQITHNATNPLQVWCLLLGV